MKKLISIAAAIVLLVGALILPAYALDIDMDRTGSITATMEFWGEPVPGGTLTYAKASYRSPYGLVESGWEKTTNGVKYTLTVPSNTTAEVFLPDGLHKVLGAGAHEINYAEMPRNF